MTYVVGGRINGTTANAPENAAAGNGDDAHNFNFSLIGGVTDEEEEEEEETPDDTGGTGSDGETGIVSVELIFD